MYASSTGAMRSAKGFISRIPVRSSESTETSFWTRT